MKWVVILRGTPIRIPQHRAPNHQSRKPPYSIVHFLLRIFLGVLTFRVAETFLRRPDLHGFQPRLERRASISWGHPETWPGQEKHGKP